MRASLRISSGNERSESIKLRFTKGALERFPAPAEGRIFIYDELVPGLCMAISKAGGRVFYRYGRVDGRPQRVRIGAFPATSVEVARKAASKINGQVADGQDPQEAKRRRRSEITLGDAFDYHLEHFAKTSKKTWREDQRMFDTYLEDWKSRRLSTIRTADLQALHTRMGEQRGRYIANRVMELVSKLFGTAKTKLEWKGDNPAAAVDHFKEESRDRFVLPEEMPRLLKAIDDYPDAAWRNYFRLLLLTGVRKTNALTARWEAIDFNRAVWRLPDTKNGKPVVVELVPQAIEVLESQRDIAGESPWVFPTTRPSKVGHLIQPNAAWHIIRKVAGLDDVRLHDLRRTHGSWQALSGSSLPTIGASLGHRSVVSTAVYARLSQAAVRVSVGRAVDAMLATKGVE